MGGSGGVVELRHVLNPGDGLQQLWGVYHAL